MNDIVMKDIEREYEEFVYIVSHDLNAPLRHLKEFTKLLVSSIGDDLKSEEQSYVNFIEKSLSRLDQMQAALLRLSRVNTSEEKKSNIDSHAMVKDVISNLDLSKYQNKPTITYDDLPEIYGQREMLIGVFHELIDNACRYGFGDGEQKVHISAKETDENIIFEIEDNGIGIDTQLSEVVFTMFRRLHNQDEHGGGVGAGLTIVKRAIEHHGGQIWIKSKLDEGTKIFFSIPKKA